MTKAFRDGQAVWVQGKKAVVSHTDQQGQVWVTFENDDSGSYAYDPERVCVRSIHKSDRAELRGDNFVD